MRNIIIYSRVSTDRQTLAQQERTVSEWLKFHNLTATAEIADEGISGGVSYKERKLGTEILPMLHAGDILIVAELSRLGRSMNDVNNLVVSELKPRGVRLVVVQAGLDLDCSQIKAVDQMILTALSFAAQMEKELIQERTRSALEVRKSKLRADGSFVSKKGNTVTRLGSPDISKACAAAAAAKREKARSDENNRRIWGVLSKCSVGGNPPTTEALGRAVLEFAAADIKTPTGKTMNVRRARACYHNLKRIFA